ncbi:FkbM family methyltransferase [Candidatus Shapirobacteria bacterium]|nr:FkbM family methyltransferase [Candidatus Shapirobacteria bacterium]
MKLAKTKLNGLDFWYRSDDKFIGQRIALGKYEEYETLLMLNQVDSNSVVVDIGANIGYYTLLLAQKCKMVYAFEPDKECFEILKKNVEENGLKNVKLFNVAVGAKKEKRVLIKDKENLGNSHLTPPPYGHLPLTGEANILLDNSYLVETDTLDNILKNEQKIDLIKIDVQGWEPEVVEGAKGIIKKYSPTLFMEYNGGNIDFLKKAYKNIWSIDYWFYICRRGIKVNKKTGYVDLWLKKEFSLSDYWWTVKEIQVKKVLKHILDM